MYCPNCGEPIPDGAKFCYKFGASLGDGYSRDTRVDPSTYNYDSGSFGWAVLGFFIPLVGLILYLVWKDERPKSAKRAGKGALVSVILYLIVIAIYVIVFVIALGSVIDSATGMAIASLI